MDYELMEGFRFEKNKKISEKTATRWLKKLGWEFKTYKKGLYSDGHERPDVVEYRKEFLKFMEEEYEPYVAAQAAQ